MEYGSFYVLYDKEKNKFYTNFGGLTTSIFQTEHYSSFDEANKKAKDILSGSCEVREATIILKD